MSRIEFLEFNLMCVQLIALVYIKFNGTAQCQINQLSHKVLSSVAVDFCLLNIEN